MIAGDTPHPLLFHLSSTEFDIIYSEERNMQGEVIPPAALNPVSATILIAEDDMDIGEFLQHLIEEETPYHTIIVPDGPRAVKTAQQIHPCLLLLDYRLPGLNGLEVYDRLQQLEETRGVPAIMMSARIEYHDEEIKQHSLFELGKPFALDEFITAIGKSLA